MKRKFLVNIVFLLAVSIIVKAFWVLGIDRTVQNVAGEEAYGFYFSLFSFSVLFTLLLDMGLSGFNNRAVSADPTRVKLYFGNVLLLRLLLTAAYFLVTVTVAWAMGYTRHQFTLLLVLMLNQVMSSMILWLRSNISGMQYLFLDSLLSVADRLVMIIICSLLLWGGMTSGPFRIEWFVWAQTAAYFIVMVISFILVIRRGGVSKVRPDVAVLKSIIITGLPFALVAFAMTLYWRIDSVLIERLLPDGAMQAGIYAQAFRLFDAIAMFPVMFGGLLLPIMSKELAVGNNIAPLASMAGRMLLAPLGIGAVTLATFPGEILDLLYHAPSPEAVSAFTVLMIDPGACRCSLYLQHNDYSSRPSEDVRTDNPGRDGSKHPYEPYTHSCLFCHRSCLYSTLHAAFSRGGLRHCSRENHEKNGHSQESIPLPACAVSDIRCRPADENTGSALGCGSGNRAHRRLCPGTGFQDG